MDNQIKTKTKIRIVVFLLFSLLVLGVIFPHEVRAKYQHAVNLELSGIVSEVVWHTSNHDLPLFQIRNKNGVVTNLNNGELNFRQGQIKVGDFIEKKRGSQKCSINSTEIICVPDYVSFYSQLANFFKYYFSARHA